MADRGGFWGRIFGAQSDEQAPTHSFEELQRIHNVLLDPSNQVVNAQNKATLIETLRELAELLIWGDQNDPRVFEYFLEHNLLRHYKRILAVPSHRRGQVAVQLLQTLSILITNISKQTSMFFLFSNNHLNEIIALEYDLRDEEVLAHFITLLKTISFKLNKDTIQFFFQVDANKRAHFPLYTEAKKLFNHSEGMVRAAVRMLTINVYSVADHEMQEFVSSSPCSHYFHEVSQHLTQHAMNFDGNLEALHSESFVATTYLVIFRYLHFLVDCLVHGNRMVELLPKMRIFSFGRSSVLKDMGYTMTEIEDYLSYVGDVIEVANPRLRTEVSRKFWDGFVEPVIINPLLVSQNLDGTSGFIDSSNTQLTTASLKPATSLYCVERIFAQLRAPSMLEALACALLAGPAVPVPRPPLPASSDGDAAVGPDSMSEALSGAGDGNSGRTVDSMTARRGDDGGSRSQRLAPSGSLNSVRSAALSVGGARLTRCRDAMLSCLRSAHAPSVAAAVRALTAAASAHLPVELAAALGLAIDPSGDLAPPGSAPLPGITGFLSDDLSGSVPLPDISASIAGSSRQQLSPRPSLATTASFGVSAALSLASDILVDDLVRTVVSNRMRPIADGNTRRIAAQHRHEISDALLRILTRTDISGPALASAGWLLSHILPGPAVPIPSPPSELSSDGAAVLRAAASAACQRLLADCKGIWADALLPLAHVEWRRLRPITTRGTLRCQASDLLHFITPPMHTRPQPSRPLDPCAVAAVAALATVSRVCVLSQIRHLLHTASVPGDPPLPPYHADSSAISEGTTMCISNLTAHPCRVSFRRGDERHALLTVITPNSHNQPLGCGSPHAVLLSPAPRAVSAGTALSSAPLLATAAEAHEQHQKWLKATVRPTVGMLLEAVNASRQQGMPFSLNSKAHQLGDGVWVLALESPNAVKDVIEHLTRSKEEFQVNVSKLLSPLCTMEDLTGPQSPPRPLEDSGTFDSGNRDSSQTEGPDGALLSPRRSAQLTGESAAASGRLPLAV